MTRFDAIVVGAGVNGLTCAAYLAKAGRKVMVVDARDAVGGASVGPMLGDARCLGPVDCSSFRSQVVSDLGLENHGLRLSARAHSTLVVGKDGRWIHSSDASVTKKSLAELSKKDAEGFAAFREVVDAVKPVVRAFTDNPPLDFINLETAPKMTMLMRALGLRRLGRARMLDLFRVAPMTAADWLDEFFESGLVKAGIAVPALGLAHAGPRAPGTAANVLLAAAAPRRGVEGGAIALVDALAASCRERGVEIVTSKAAMELVVEGGRVGGVTLADGATVEAGTVVGGCNPKQVLLDMVPRGTLPARTLERADNWRSRGTIGHLAALVEGQVEVDGADRLVVVDDLNHLERAFDATKYGEVPNRPALEAQVSSAGDDTLVSIAIHHLPTAPVGGYSDDMREAATKASLAVLSLAIPGVADRVKSTELRCPPDLGAELRTHGGHLGHGEAALDQLLVRPIPECSQYKTPIDGLFLASSGTHGGSDMSGLPGAFAARAVLRRR